MAAQTSSEFKLSLKLMVDVKANKVVFAEADKAFVDFIFNIISMPLSTVTKLLLDNKMVLPGSLGTLYKSIESMGVQYMEPNINCESVLKPKSSVVVPVLSLYDYPPSTSRIYTCTKNHHISDVPGMCPCGQVMSVIKGNYVRPHQKTAESPGYARESVPYMVMDNFEVKPMSLAVIKSYVADFDILEEKHVEVGLQEGLAILEAFMESANVLTTAFLKN